MRYVMAKYRTDIQDMTYRFYMSDCLNYINQNKYLTVRYSDMVKGKSKTTADVEKSGEEIAAEVIAKAGLVVE